MSAPGPKFAPAAIGAIVMFAALTASAMPILQDYYNDHPQSLPQNRDECVICHVNADGSGKLTAFGKKYERAGLEFTASLVASYPNLFDVDGSGVALAQQQEESGDSGLVVPGNEVVPFEARAYYLEECTECHGKYGEGDPFQGVPAFADHQWIADRGSLPDEMVIIILEGKDKMKGHAGKINDEDAYELYALIMKIAEKYV